ncbi:amidohydrolase family protein [Marinactinospora rubrisoli]|uniref:Amidohydrolase family protein n=1 Tax=Marinactinospora rubrisoli TaxID=2715399 RepID=A0ABW2KFK5_9ACTN
MTETPDTVPRVDAHHHLWDTARRNLPWMDGPWADPLHGRFDAHRYAQATAERGISASVVVQAATDPAETRELLAVASVDPVVRAVVGWVDLTAPDVADVLAGLRTGPAGERLVGVRHPVQDEPDPGWLLRPDVRRGIAAVGRAGLRYDLLVRPPQFAAAVATVHAHPEVRFVLDHLGKPRISPSASRGADGDDGWSQGLAALAAAPNVTAKLSGLVTEADRRTWTPQQLMPFGRRALDLFGPHRLMYGSDWPVCTLAADYRQVLDIAETITDGLSGPERAAVFGGTAVRWYGLDRLLP